MDNKDDGPPRSEKWHACYGRRITPSAGLVAIHPVAEAPEDEYFYFAWLLRYEAFLRFGYDPDAVFSEKTDDCGFRK